MSGLEHTKLLALVSIYGHTFIWNGFYSTMLDFTEKTYTHRKILSSVSMNKKVTSRQTQNQSASTNDVNSAVFAH